MASTFKLDLLPLQNALPFSLHKPVMRVRIWLPYRLYYEYLNSKEILLTAVLLRSHYK